MKGYDRERMKNNNGISPITFPIPHNKINNEININDISRDCIVNCSKEELIKAGIDFHVNGNINQAKKYYKQFIDMGYSDPKIFCNYGILLKDQYNLEKSEYFIRKAIEIDPNFAQAYSNLGILLMDKGKLYEAENCQREAIRIDPKFAFAHYNLAIILKDLGRFEEAEISNKKAIEILPTFANAYSNLGSILKKLRKIKEAEKIIRQAIKINPNIAESYINLGIILKDIGKINEAQLCLSKAIKISPNSAEAHTCLGNIFKDLGKIEEAEFYFRKAIQIKPNFAEGYSNLANMLRDIGQFIEAIYFYEKAIKFNSELSIAKAGLIGCRALVCDWSEKKKESIWLNTLGIEGSSVGLLDLLYSEDNARKQLKRATKFYNENYYRNTESIQISKKEKIHVGYFSSDFRAHPTMYLIASILELHDKSKFKIYLYSFAPNEDEYTSRAKKSGCIFKNIKELDNIEVVKIAREDKLDIAIDLMGYIQYNRMNIFSHRVAPIQINFLGYPASLGASTFEYIIADDIIIPKKNEIFYSEKIIRMPNCYQCNDNKKNISNDPISRNEFNLPDKGFIFTCFNANNKITPNEFNIWMRLLKEIKGSVLWLFHSNKWSIQNLKKEAKKRNVNPKRLIFAKSLPLSKHLARHVFGDLALDTFNYNGHTTTSDALWTGLPVITKIGESFAARVSASLLNTLGVPELITHNEKEYEEKALYLARNKNELLRLRKKIETGKRNSTLYDSKLFTKNLEEEFIKLIF